MTEAQGRAIKKWDEAHPMISLSARVRSHIAEDFKAACAAEGKTVHTVLKEFILEYIENHK